MRSILVYIALCKMNRLEAYDAPSWIPRSIDVLPSSRVQLSQLPTPIHPWQGFPSVDIKRDDYTGSEMSGNKVRKLEFLLAHAIELGATDIVTVGGLQSNHCRATAVAARRLGLKPHLILRGEAQDALGRDGNLFIDRLFSAEIHMASDSEFEQLGGQGLVDRLVSQLEAQNKTVYGFPSGGSNAMGTWGYIEATRELLDQGLNTYERVYLACGSGGTTAGLALAFKLANVQPNLIGLCVDDSPEFFYNKIYSILQNLLGEITLRRVFPTKQSLQAYLRLEQSKGQGYAISTDSELRFISNCARDSGVLLDPVYTGKAALGMVNDLQKYPLSSSSQRALFIHTGGLLGIFPKANQIDSILQSER
uniref:Tryptophan synthase beta chain-like PALP domain-containing protein n=1 Tax=Aureoumbra lagunensis TaxID=44058 RepID=A0A7S3JXU0_9STRA|mmetsp:Transcript_1934/g.2576  ORF Transcript_1934/g.2576 Transcript_1934/m.2576 type:complete len:364 (+) Transcript_1934:48-1139(+)